MGVNFSPGFEETDYSFINDFLDNLGSPDWKFMKMNNGVRVFRYRYEDPAGESNQPKTLLSKLRTELKYSQTEFKNIQKLKAFVCSSTQTQVGSGLAV